MLEPQVLIRKATSDIEWRLAQIVKAKINLDYDASAYNQEEYNRHIAKLSEEMNYRQILCEKFREYGEPVEIPSIGKWALGI